MTETETEIFQHLNVNHARQKSTCAYKRVQLRVWSGFVSFFPHYMHDPHSQGAKEQTQIYSQFVSKLSHA